jgi:hypothetical protein
MSLIKKTYTLNKMKQLVDLNGDTTNFNLTFTATTKDGSNFDALVVDQTTLDSTPSLEYKKAKGTISGNIISDKNVYQNYFLLLKSDKPCECDVTIEKKEIQPAKKESTQQPVKKESVRPTLLPPVKKSSNLKWIIIIVLIILGIGTYWYMDSKKKTGSQFASTISPSPSPSPSPSSSSFSPSPSPSPSPYHPSYANTSKSKTSSSRLKKAEFNFGFGGTKENESLLERLNSLPMY